MKNLFKNPLFYVNIFLLILLILLSASINPNSTNLPSFAKKALAAVQNILGEGTVNSLAAFTGVNEIGNSIIYDDGTNVGIGITNPAQKLDVGSGPLDNVSANDYWIQAANGGVGIWASQLGAPSPPPPFSCGNNLAISHIAGDTSPVTKTVTYGTVFTDLSGAPKCWITRNLGATNQAASATDFTEASAGWYWQFNRRQGYKHDGTTRTPSTTWITSIDENSDWILVNDPCNFLLGIGWRLPTKNEWTNADANGSWNNTNDAYASVLKLHAAGALSGGNLFFRGIFGYYWSSTQYNSVNGHFVIFTGSTSNVGNAPKVLGNSVRCIKD